MLYLLESSDYYKIGYTLNEETLEKRLKSYHTHNPEFELVDLYEGDKKEENKIHKLCKDFKYKGEWFIKDDFILDRLSELGKLPKTKVERYVVTIVGNLNYIELDVNEEIKEEVYD